MKICGNDGDICIGSCIDKTVVYKKCVTIGLEPDSVVIVSDEGKVITEYYRDHNSPSQATGVAMKRYFAGEYDK